MQITFGYGLFTGGLGAHYGVEPLDGEKRIGHPDAIDHPIGVLLSAAQ